MKNKKNICDSCNNAIVTRCFKPSDTLYNGEPTYTMELQDEVRSNETECQFYDKTTTSQKVKNFFNRIKYYIVNKFADLRVFFVYNLYGRIKYGFDLTDLWSLDSSITKFVYPRLKRFVEKGTQGYPSVISDDEYMKNNNLEYLIGADEMTTWNNILNKILKAFEVLNSDEYTRIIDKHEDVKEGLRLFGIFYSSLWD